MKLMNKTALVISAFAIVIGLGAATAYAGNSTKTMSEPHMATEDEIADPQNQVSTIQTKFGIFERNDQAKITSDDVVVHDSVFADSKTTVIVEPSGTFVRK